MEWWIELLWLPALALVLLILDPLRSIGGLVLGLVARPWWVVLPGVVIVSAIMEAIYVKFWAHSASFNSWFMGSVIALIAAWTGLWWRGSAPRLSNKGS